MSGAWERPHAAWRERTRQRAGREPTPSAGIVDSLSSKTTERGPPNSSGYDGGKHVKGRKRHLLVDTLGLVVTALVHPADVPDGEGGLRLRAASPHRATALPRRHHLGADSATHGRFKDGGEQTVGWTVAVVKRPARWRCTSKDYACVPPPRRAASLCR